MRLFSGAPLLALAAFAGLTEPVQAERILKSNSLNSCQAKSSFSAKLFNVVYRPDNNTASVDVVASSSVQGYVKFSVLGSAYGYEFLHEVIDPCDLDKEDTLKGLCPMNAGNIPFGFSIDVPKEAASRVPGIAYTIPDLDAKVRIYVNLTKTGETTACIEANVSNGKTVDLPGVKWATAVIAGLALMASGVLSGLGHTNAAAHVAANSLSLFGFFQSQAIVGLTGVKQPPLVQAWTQNFQWSLGIIKVDFMQTIFTWYQRATGGSPATIFDSLRNISVQVQKRSLDAGRASVDLFKRGLAMMPAPGLMNANLMKRGNVENESGGYVVFGIQRVAFKAGIETTNLFMTGLIFFCIFVIFTVIAVAAFKGILELLSKQKIMKSDKFQEFRNGWVTVLKGILFRVALLGFPPVTILCLWEFTQTDSPAEVVLAVVFLVGLLVTLGWGASKVILIARRSVAMHRNPAYILFSDPQALNKWGFLYIQFRASAYYFIVPVLAYTLVKAMFVAFAQHNGVAQAIGFLIFEAAALIAASVLRPWMDKPTNSFNIAICVVNFLNAICILIFSDVFGAPALAAGAVGLFFFALNAAFSLILLLMVIISTTIVFWRKNPDARYQFMADDRASFMKSASQLNTTTELDALAATARGDKAGYGSKLDLDEEHDSMGPHRMMGKAGPTESVTSLHGQGPRSPVNPNMPMFPAGGRPESPFRPASPSPYNGSGSSLSGQRVNTASPGPAPGGYRPPPQQQKQSSSPWQRGAGYDH